MTTFYVPLFDGNQYECWSLKMKTLLKAINLWDVVETGTQTEPPEETFMASHEFEEQSSESYSAQWKQWIEMKDTTALYIIQTGLTSEIFPWISCAKSSKEAWELLMVRSIGGAIFQARKLVDLKKEFKDMTMKDSETIHEFTEKLMELVFLMKSCGFEFEDKQVVKKIMSSLSPRFDNVLVEVAETLSISEVIDCLLVHEYNMKLVQGRGRFNFMNKVNQRQEALMERRIESLFRFCLGFFFLSCLVLFF